MKKHLIILFLFFSSYITSQDIVESKGGFNYAKSQAIAAEVIDFETRIHKLQYDSVRNTLFMQLRGLSKSGKYLNNKGEILLANLNELDVRWRLPLNFQQSYSSYSNAGIIINEQGRKTSLYCLQTGEKIWKDKFAIQYQPNNDIMLVYKATTMNGITDLLQARDVQTKEILWEREVKHKFGWNEIRHLNDSILLLSADNLEAINLNNGNGWVQDIKTGTTDYTSVAVAGAVGIVAGILTGAAVIPVGGDIVRELCSNIILTDSDIYLADCEGISKFNHSGYEIWRNEFPAKTGSNSVIVHDSTHIYMINYGHGTLGVRHVNVGRPFIACFDKEDGSTVYFNRLTKKKDQIEDAYFADDTFYMLFDDGIATKHINDTSQIEITAWDDKRYGKIRLLVKSEIYIPNQDKSIFYKVSKLNGCINVYGEENNVYELANDFSVARAIPRENVYTCACKWKNYDVITSRNGNSFLVDETGTKVAEFSFDSFLYICDGYLYGVENAKLFRVNLAEF